MNFNCWALSGWGEGGSIYIPGIKGLLDRAIFFSLITFPGGDINTAGCDYGGGGVIDPEAWVIL